MGWDLEKSWLIFARGTKCRRCLPETARSSTVDLVIRRERPGRRGNVTAVESAGAGYRTGKEELGGE